MGRNKTIEDQAVLEVARDVFRREGHGASTRDIARAAGLSQAALYQRFGSKEELFFRAMTPDPPDLGDLLGAPPGADGRAELEGLALRLFDYVRSFSPTLLHVLAAHGTDVERLKEWHAQLPFLPITEGVARRFEQMAAAGHLRVRDPRASASAFLASIHSLAFFELLTTAQERGAHRLSVPSLVTVLWDGFRPD